MRYKCGAREHHAATTSELHERWSFCHYKMNIKYQENELMLGRLLSQKQPILYSESVTGIANNMPTRRIACFMLCEP